MGCSAEELLRYFRKSSLYALRVWCLSIVFIAPAAASSSVDQLRAQWVSAISNDNTQTLNTLLQQSISAGSADTVSLWNLSAGNGKTALMVACKVGDTSFAKQLVSLGANIKTRTGTDGTAFMFAVLGDQQALAAWLLELGADIDARGSNGWTSVMIAAAKGLDKTLLWLLQQGADANRPDVYGFSPLMRASDNGHAKAVALLLSMGEVDVHWQDEVNNTALHYAVSADQLEIVQRLLAAGAKPDVLNRAELSPLALVAASLKVEGINSGLLEKRKTIHNLLQAAVQ